MISAPPDWTTLGFGYFPTDVIYRAVGDAEASPAWAPGELLSQDAVKLPVAAAVLSYGAGIIEGLKAERAADGRILLFRPADHAARFFASADRMMLLPFPRERFVDAARQLCRANARFVPPAGAGTFYLRPIELAVEPMLGLRVARHVAVMIYGCPVGELGHGAVRALKALDVPRATAGGTAEAKAIVNYAGVLHHREQARAEGFDDVLFSAGGGVVQETTGTNVFCRLRSGKLVTPARDGCFLPGITRDSVLQLARHAGVTVQERELRVEEILDEGVELFCTGTATGVRGVELLVHRGREKRFVEHELARELGGALAAIRCGAAADPFGWVEPVDER